jgi:fermentation-respiration switch protein FrsA (DUF1100 family)
MIPMMLKALTDAMLFHPERGQHHTPADADTVFEDLRIVGEDGVRTQAWWIPAVRETPGVTVLFFHGNAGTIADRLPLYLSLQRGGVSVLAAEYRGYGDSEGSPSETGLMGDGRAALREAHKRAGRDRLVVAGRSLGGAVAVQTAASAEPGTVAGLWIESTFTDLRSMAAQSGIPLGARLVPYDFDSIGVIGTVGAPVIVFHGDRDDLIPHRHGEALAEAVRVGGGDARFVSLPGADHNGTPPAAARIKETALQEFLSRVGKGTDP